MSGVLSACMFHGTVFYDFFLIYIMQEESTSIGLGGWYRVFGGTKIRWTFRDGEMEWNKTLAERIFTRMLHKSVVNL